MKRIVLIAVCVAMIASLAACQGAAHSSNPPSAASEKATPSPVPDPTEDPALEAAEAQGIFLPDLEATLMCDYAEIEAYLRGHNVWIGAYEETADGTVQLPYEEIVAFEEDGGYRGLNNMIGPVVYSGEWRITPDGLEVAELSGQVSTAAVIVAQSGTRDYLYIYYDKAHASVYVPADEAQTQTLYTDPEEIAQFRYFLCSASWEMRGVFDAAGTYSDTDSKYTYTFVPWGEVVCTQDGVKTAGQYVLNVDSIAIAFEGEEPFSGLVQQDSTTGISYIYLFDEDYSGACRVFWAVETLDVSDVVQKPADENAPFWAVRIGEFDAMSDGLAHGLETMDVEANLVHDDGSSETVICTGYLLEDVLEFANAGDVKSVTIVYANGVTRELADVIIGGDANLLVVKVNGVYVDQAYFCCLKVVPESPVTEIVVNG